MCDWCSGVAFSHASGRRVSLDRKSPRLIVECRPYPLDLILSQDQTMTKAVLGQEMATGGGPGGKGDGAFVAEFIIAKEHPKDLLLPAMHHACRPCSPLLRHCFRVLLPQVLFLSHPSQKPIPVLHHCYQDRSRCHVR